MGYKANDRSSRLGFNIYKGDATGWHPRDYVCGNKKHIFLMGSQDIFSYICGDQIRYFKSEHVLSLTLT